LFILHNNKAVGHYQPPFNLCWAHQRF